MYARPVAERTRVAAAAPGSPRAGAVRNGSASYVLALQRSAGNAAVTQHLAVQRCGPVPCDCSPEERAEKESPSLQRAAVPGTVLQRFPGDGMTPPGDCGYGQYIPLRMAVESAKAVVSMLGSCSPGDSCTFLATKIAAISAEIAARVALDATCFKGGDTGHRQQVQDKINMLNRCYRFFQASNCSPDLIAAMEVVVARAREVIEGAAAVVAAAVIVAAVVALVAAIIALAEVIMAAVAAAAEAAAIGAAVAAMVAVLALIRQNVSAGAPASA
jgi:Novel toxin 16